MGRAIRFRPFTLEPLLKFRLEDFRLILRRLAMSLSCALSAFWVLGTVLHLVVTVPSDRFFIPWWFP